MGRTMNETGQSRLLRIETDIDQAANQLRVASAAGGATIVLPPEHCIRLARRIESGRAPAPPAPLIVHVEEFPAFWGWWLRLLACLLLTDAVFRAGLSLARWIAAF